MNPIQFLLCTATSVAVACVPTATAQVFSGPQVGETATPFKVLELSGPNDGKERDPIAENAGVPTAIVFLHAIERSLLPLLRAVDNYGAEHKDRLKTEVIFLSADRLEGERRVRAANGSLRLQGRVGLSLDGLEGPGNYGLNKECMMTIVAAKDDKVTANFALVQPGIADAPKVIEALARTCDDPNPPNADQIMAQFSERGRRGRPGQMQREGMEPVRSRSQSTDWSRFDLDSEAGVRDAVRALMAEIQSLRTQLAELREPKTSESGDPNQEKPREPFPGAVPTDARLQSLLRQFIRPTNDDARVDALLAETTAYIKGNADLTQQAIDGWTRVLHFGDRYGTEYSRKVGQELLDKLKHLSQQQ